jgi:hypothetical protein
MITPAAVGDVGAQRAPQPEQAQENDGLSRERNAMHPMVDHDELYLALDNPPREE